MTEKQTFEGRFSLGKNGIAFIKNKETGNVFEIPAHLNETALNRDIVLVEITDNDKNEGRVLEVVARAKAGYVGIIKVKGDHFVVDPEDYKVPEINIPNDKADNPTPGEKVFVVIENYGTTLSGRVTRKLGLPDSNDAHMHGIALEQGFDFNFPEDVQKEADHLEEVGITEDEKKNRRDMRNTLTFTIDPADAKDFDDALSFTTLDNGNYEIGIHIADVSHYVTPGSALDQEAQKRTTSVYLVDRTIPMLPEELSNGLCSLRQDEEKLAFSAVFEIEPKTGDVMGEWYGRTIINSNKRFTYEEAQDIIDHEQGLYADELLELNRISKIYTRNRHNNGALNFETHEVKFILDEEGKPISVKVKERIDTNKLIEEFMLLANQGVARFMQDADFFVYRVHDKPESERVEKLSEFLKILGYKPQLTDGIISPFDLQTILKEAEGTPAYDTLQTAIVRSMQKAVYTTENIGHFGLAFKHYSHFTSPIRRYPDVLAHRLLQFKLDQKVSDLDQAWHEKMCLHSSNKESAAVTAERNSIKLKQVEYMSEKDTETVFEGIVTGCGKFGVFVAEAESLSEGMIRLSDLGNDFFEFKEKSGVIIGKKTGISYKIGDRLKMRIKRVDIQKRLIDYRLFLTPEQRAEMRKNNPRNRGGNRKPFKGRDHKNHGHKKPEEKKSENKKHH